MKKDDIQEFYNVLSQMADDIKAMREGIDDVVSHTEQMRDELVTIASADIIAEDLDDLFEVQRTSWGKVVPK